MSKKTLVLGASTNPDRVSYTAVHKLKNHGHEVVLVGQKKGEVAGEVIHNDQPLFQDIDTLTLYVGPKNQPELYDYIMKIRPKRIVFNPGTENEELRVKAEKAGIETEYACTLVMLSLNNY
jgi:hypothetical protein